MPNLDRQYEDKTRRKNNTNIIYGIMFFIVFGIPILLLISYLIFPSWTKGVLNSFNTDQPSCQYYGDSYECE